MVRCAGRRDYLAPFTFPCAGSPGVHQLARCQCPNSADPACCSEESLHQGWLPAPGNIGTVLMCQVVELQLLSSATVNYCWVSHSSASTLQCIYSWRMYVNEVFVWCALSSLCCWIRTCGLWSECCLQLTVIGSHSKQTYCNNIICVDTVCMCLALWDSALLACAWIVCHVYRYVCGMCMYVLYVWVCCVCVCVYVHTYTLYVRVYCVCAYVCVVCMCLSCVSLSVYAMLIIIGVWLCHFHRSICLFLIVGWLSWTMTTNGLWSQGSWGCMWEDSSPTRQQSCLPMCCTRIFC